MFADAGETMMCDICCVGVEPDLVVRFADTTRLDVCPRTKAEGCFLQRVTCFLAHFFVCNLSISIGACTVAILGLNIVGAKAAS